MHVLGVLERNNILVLTKKKKNWTSVTIVLSASWAMSAKWSISELRSGNSVPELEEAQGKSTEERFFGPGA